jgi:hypothetical protein
MKVDVRVTATSANKSERARPQLSDFDEEDFPVLMPATRMTA